MKIGISLAGEMSGSIGSVTASRNRGGAYLRRRAIPMNPNTDRQQAIRSNFGSMVNAWTEALTNEQRTAWNNYAANVPRVDALGNSYQMSGQQAFIGVNTIRLQAAQAIVTTAPAIQNTGSPPTAIQSFEADSNGSAFYSLVTFGNAISDGGWLLLYVGRPQNTSRNFYKGPYQLAARALLTAEGFQTDFDLAMNEPTEWLANYALLPDMVVPVRLRAIYDDGRLSQPLEEMIVVSELT